jgi:hypothetical protein
MKETDSISTEIENLVNEWENVLIKLPEETISNRRNSQNRTIKQIVGHLVDSATNNTHRIIHLHYQPQPLVFPNYASFGNNDRWIAIQNYQNEDWKMLIQVWKYSLLHVSHVIRNINPDKLENEWICRPDKILTMKEMIIDFPRHLNLHLAEINELINID